MVTPEGAYWFDLGSRALPLGWTWRPGMWAMDADTDHLLDGYEVELVGSAPAARRVRDGAAGDLTDGSLVPYLNDEGVAVVALLERVRLLRREPSSTFTAARSAARPDHRDGSGSARRLRARRDPKPWSLPASRRGQRPSCSAGCPRSG